MNLFHPQRVVATVATVLVAAVLVGGCAPTASLPASAPQQSAAPTPSAPAPITTPTIAPSAPAPSVASPTPEEPRHGGVLIVISPGDPPHLDAQLEGSTVLNSMTTAPAYNNLLYYDPKTGAKVVPELAEQWDASSDGLTYTFQLRRGIKFHDGTPLTTDDIVFNLNRVVSPPKGQGTRLQGLLTAVDKVVAEGDQSIRLTMKYPFPPLVPTLALDYMPIYAKAYVTSHGDMKTSVMGTGPFTFKSYTPGVSLEFVKNDNYWVKGRPYLDGITFAIIKDKSTQLAALRTGRALQSSRVLGVLSPSDVTALKNAVPGMRFIASPTVIGPFFFMNTRQPPFKDVRVRRAVSLAMDRQAAIKVLAEGEGALGNFFPFYGWGIPRDELAGLPGYRQPKNQDIADAKKLLADAGYPNGFKLEILSRNQAMTQNAATFVTAQLSGIGVDASVRVLEEAQFWDSGGKANFQGLVFTPGPLIADPYDMGKFFARKGGLNFTGDDDDLKLNDLWDRQIRATDEKARKAIIAELDRYLLTDLVPSVPLVWPASFIAVAAKEHGFIPGATDYSNNRHQETWLLP